MNTQFNDLTVPKFGKKYRCSPYVKSTGFTLLMKLVLSVRKFPESVDMIKHILKNEPDELDKRTNNGWNALMLACRNSNTVSNNETVKILLDAKCDLDSQDNAGLTALMLACRNTNYDSNNETVNLLLDANCNLDLQSYLKSTALMIACSNSNNCSNNETVKMLLQANCNVDLQNINGLSALMIACKCLNHHSNIETVKILLDAKCNVDFQDNEGKTALMHFLNNIKTDIDLFICMMIKSRNSITLKDKYGKTVYDYYQDKKLDILDSYTISMLKGVFCINSTKSAKNNSAVN